MTMNLGLSNSMGSSTTNHSYLSGKLTTNKKRTSSLLLSPPMSPGKLKKKRRREAMAALYTEDIGAAGVKKSTSLTGNNGQIHSFSLPETKEEKSRRLQRMARFGELSKETKQQSQKLNEGEPAAMSCALSAGREKDGATLRKNKPNQSRVVGTSTALEKPFLRLTTFPKPENVRPLRVLIKSLAHIKSEFIKKEDFEWTNEQMKSLRQDLTVQGIRNKFVLEVYETHARILLEYGDLNEFNQCQTMIRSLTSPMSAADLDDNTQTKDTYMDENFREEGEPYLQQSEDCADEFQAYGILYNLVQNNWGEMTRALTGASESPDSSSVASSESDRPGITRGSSRRHALKVVKSVVHDDYQSFFRLYETAPHMSAYLMDFLVRRVRDSAFKRIVAAYRPTLSVEHFREALHLDDLEETRRFLKKNGAIFMHEQGGPPFWVDCKSTVAAMANKKS